MERRDVTPAAISDAAARIRDGGTVIYPTETCYGIGCDATNEEAVERIYDIKQRPRAKKLTVIVDSLTTAEQYCHLSEQERAVCEAFMPGPLTLVAEKRENVPDLLNTDFAFRIPGNRTARSLAEEAGVPVVATSANLSGTGGKYRVEDIAAEVVNAVDVVLDGGRLEETPSSTVIGLTDGDVTVHRDGPVTRDDVEAVIGGS